MTDITELAQRLKAAAEKATPGAWGIARDGKTVVSNQSHPVATISDAMHRVLADGTTGQDAEFIALANPTNILALVEALEKAQDTINEMDNRIRKQNRHVCELFDDNTALRQRIAELEPIHAAAEKLVRCKGRYHSEQNYRALADLFGVTMPDLPPLDGECRTVTVKLPQAVSAGGQGYQAQVERILTAAGIKVEAE
ncbi:ead/Ea22-like family protein [Klebsiella oxytoca]